MNLSIKIGDVEFKNPVTVAAGTFGYAEKYYKLESIKKLGALVPKTITLHAREGNPPPRICETAGGMINAIGLENEGVEAFLSRKMPALKKIGVPLIISVSANTIDEFVQMIEKLNGAGAAAYELNLSCPNLQKHVLVAQDAQTTFDTVQKVKTVSSIPVIAKLTPNVTDIVEIASAARDAGADALSLVNTFTAMAIDIKTRRPVLGNITGGLSGPAIKPMALHMVWRVARKVDIPIIGMGGIMTAEDALEFLIAGATMVAVGTGNFINPRAPLEVLTGIKEYMKKNKMDNIRQLIGAAQNEHRNIPTKNAGTPFSRRAQEHK